MLRFTNPSWAERAMSERLARLTESERMVYERHVLGDATLLQIARERVVAYSTVHTLWQRARRKLNLHAVGLVYMLAEEIPPSGQDPNHGYVQLTLKGMP